MLMKVIAVILCCVCLVSCGCRKQEENSCEAICQKNNAGKLSCEIRGALILPNLASIEASLPRVNISIKVDRTEQKYPIDMKMTKIGLISGYCEKLDILRIKI